jgi:hypothetical protein
VKRIVLALCLVSSVAFAQAPEVLLAATTATGGGQETVAFWAVRGCCEVRPCASSSVSRLSRSVCPSAILWGVWSVVVDSVQGKVRAWPQSHVSQKGREGTAPFFAHFNSTRAVVSKISRVWVVASVLRPRPSQIFRAPNAVLTAAVAVHEAGDSIGFASIATATYAPATALAQDVLTNKLGRTAVAEAKPDRAITHVAIVRFTQHEKLPVSLSRDVH